MFEMCTLQSLNNMQIHFNPWCWVFLNVISKLLLGT